MFGQISRWQIQTHMHGRIQVRGLSQYSYLLATKEGRLFLERVPVLLSRLKEQQGSSKDISYWQNIANLSNHFSLRNSDFRQLKSFLQGQSVTFFTFLFFVK